MGNSNSSRKNNHCHLCEGDAPKNEWFCAQCCKQHGCIAIYEDSDRVVAISMTNGLDNFQRRGLIRYMIIPDVVQRHTLLKPYKDEDRFLLCLAKEFQHQEHYPTSEMIDEIVLRIVRKFMDDAGLEWNYLSTSMMD